MRCGIAFNIPAAYESDLYALPPLSNIRRLSRADGKETIQAFYHFQHAPQSWEEWQRVAAIKVQIKNRLKRTILDEYEPNEVTGKLYTISELGEHFMSFVKFPKPLFPNGNREAYKMLCLHAKRLHYEGLLHLEQLIATSIRFNDTDPEGMRQTVKRAKAAYMFALDYQDKWKVKLSDEKRHKVLSESAHKAAEVKRQKNNPKVLKALEHKKQGVSIKEIAKEFNVSTRTIIRWTKTTK